MLSAYRAPLSAHESLVTPSPPADDPAGPLLRGGINALIVGNYLTTSGRQPDEDLDLLAELAMPIKEHSAPTRPKALLRRLRTAGRGVRPRPVPSSQGRDRPAALLRRVPAKARSPGAAAGMDRAACVAGR